MDLNQDMADIKAWRKVTEPMLTAIAADVKTLLQKFNEAEAERANHPPCPAPELCMKLDERIRVVENAQLAQRSAGWGVWKTLAVICTLLGGIPVSLLACIEIIKNLRP